MTGQPFAAQLCGHCGYAFNQTLMLPDQAPNPPANGDIGLCLNCGKANLYDGGAWHLLTAEEYLTLSTAEKRQLGRMHARHAEGKRRGIIPDLTERDPRT